MGEWMSLEDVGMKERVKEWMIGSAVYQEEIGDETAAFHFLAEYPEKSGYYIDVICPKNKSDTIYLVGSIVIDPVHRSSMASIQPARRHEFLDDVVSHLIFQPVGFRAIPDVNDPESFEFIKDLYLDGLTKTSFMEGMGGINRCINYVIWKFSSTFGEGKVNEPPGAMYG